MIYLPKSAAKVICKKMFDIHMNIQTYPGEKWAECHELSASFLTHMKNNRIRGVSLGIIPSKKQHYIRVKFSPAVVHFISFLPAHTLGQSNNSCQRIFDSGSSRFLHVAVLIGHFCYANTKWCGVQAKKRTGLHWDVALWRSVIPSISAAPLKKMSSLLMDAAWSASDAY